MAEHVKKTLYQKLLEIQKTLLFFKKEKSGFNNNFQYVEWASLLADIRGKMDEQGVILKQEIIETKSTVITYHTKTSEKTEVLVEAKFKFTWVDCATGEKDENIFFANWFNDFDKWLGSAATYAERYFLLKYFHIPTDKDDNDANKKVWERELKSNNTNQQPKQEQPKPKKEKMQFKLENLVKLENSIKSWEYEVITIQATLDKIKEKYTITPEMEKEITDSITNLMWR